MPQAISATGVLAKLNDEVDLSVEGLATTGYNLVATGWNGSVVFEGTLQNSAPAVATWIPIALIDQSSGGTVTSATAGGNFRGDVSAFVQIRARCSVFVAGTMAVTLQGSAAAGSGSNTIIGGNANSGQQDANRIPRTVHLAAGALPAASAYTNQAAFAVADHLRSIAYYVTYTRGAAGGFPRFRLLWGNGTEEGRDLFLDGTPTVAQPNAQVSVYEDELNGPIPADGTALTYVVACDVPGGVTTSRLLAAEFGAPGTPGTIQITLTAGSQ